MNIVTYAVNITGMTRETLAAKIGRTVQTLWRWENQKSSPRKEDIDKIASLMGLSSWELLKKCSCAETQK